MHWIFYIFLGLIVLFVVILVVINFVRSRNESQFGSGNRMNKKEMGYIQEKMVEMKMNRQIREAQSRLKHGIDRKTINKIDQRRK